MSKRLDRSELDARRIEGAAADGWQGLHGAARTGRPPLLNAYDQKHLITVLKAGALAQGYSSDPWTLGRVGKLIDMAPPQGVVACANFTTAYMQPGP
jgi:transposase